MSRHAVGPTSDHLDRRRLAAIIEAQQLIATQGPDFESVAGAVVSRAQSITNADGAVVELLDGEEMVYAAASGLAESFVGLRLKVESSLSGHCIRSREIAISEDTDQDPRVDREATRKIGIRSMLLVPLVDAGESYGVLKVLSSEPRGFPRGDIRTLRAMASLLAVSIRRAMDYELLQKQQQELRLAKEAAESGTRAKSRFLASMSHEIRTPINAILGFAQLLMRDQTLSETQRDYIETVFRSGHLLLSIVNDVLEMSKIEAGMTSLNPDDIELQPLLEQLHKMFQVRLQEKPVKFRLERTEGTDIVIKADAAKLRQILINLLSNAVKFTDKGSITLRADAQPETGAPDRVLLRFEIKDTGCGIEPERQEEVFAEFVQADPGLRQVEGSGLGLSICRAFIELMQGSIRLESEPGKGTTVYVEIRVSAGDPKFDGQADLIPNRWRLAERHQGARALIVDDRRDNRRLLVQLLGNAGFETIEARSGGEALEAHRNHPADVVLTDIHMPGMDGVELIRRIRSSKREQPLIVAISANVLSSTANEALAAGADAFLTKPYGDAELFGALSSEPRFDLIEEQAERKEGVSSIDKRRLRDLPEELVRTIRNAAETADIDRLTALVEEVTTVDPKAARALSVLVHRIDLAAIHQALEEPDRQAQIE